MLRFLTLLLASSACAAAEFDCMIEARQTVEIRSSVEAVIESVKVTRGSFVAKGQVIVTLESGPERAALALAQGRAETQGDIKVSEARVGITRKKWQRAEELFEQNFISANALDEAEADFKLASHELQRARETQLLMRLVSEPVAVVLAVRSLLRPVDGLVVDVLRALSRALSAARDPARPARRQLARRTGAQASDPGEAPADRIVLQREQERARAHPVRAAGLRDVAPGERQLGDQKLEAFLHAGRS